MKLHLLQRLVAYFLFFVICTISWAYDAKIDGIYYNFNGNEAIVTYQKVSTTYGYISDYSGSVVIPSTITYNGKNYTVTTIGFQAFNECTGLTAVTIPNSITHIGSHTFYGCSGLKSVTIPNSVTSIEDCAFQSCSGLTTITIPESVTNLGTNAFDNTAWFNKLANGLVYLGRFAYKYKGTMPDNTKITIKEGTWGIADGAFLGCNGLTSITIPNSVTSIGENAFRSCRGLTSVTIPNSVTNIGEDAFGQCKKLTSIAFGDNVAYIGRLAFDDTAWYNNQPDGLVYAGPVAYKYKGTMPENTNIAIQEGTLGIAASSFQSCSTLISASIPNSVTSIGESAFSGCTDMTSITIGNSVASIGNSAFYNCRSVTSIDIPNSVTSIGNGAFKSCSGLTTITIPESVTSIGNSAFYNCSGLTSVTCMAKQVPNTNANAFDGDYPESIKLYVPEAAIDDYKATAPWSNFGTILPIAEPTYIVGDANGNGEVEIGDVTSVLTLMATPEATGYNNQAADANGNGEIEIGDVTAILNIMANGE